MVFWSLSQQCQQGFKTLIPASKYHSPLR